MDKRFQVFVSSTYEDLRVERQTAVEAILKAGHIPAGMELFTAGDTSQMGVIRRWIDDSDIFMLILGARYGSIEPSTGKSYVELELDYAIETKTPFFAVVLSDEGREAKVKEYGTAVLELGNEAAYRALRERVLSHLCAFFTTPVNVKVAVLETLPQIAKANKLVGWVHASHAASSPEISTELARLSGENSKLRSELERLRKRTMTAAENAGVQFKDLFQLLLKATVTVPQSISGAEEEIELSLLDMALMNAGTLAAGVTNSYGGGDSENWLFANVASALASYC